MLFIFSSLNIQFGFEEKNATTVCRAVDKVISYTKEVEKRGETALLLDLNRCFH